MKRGPGSVAVALAVGLVLAPAGHAADQQAIQRAVDRGVAYLKQAQQADGTWLYPAPQIPEPGAATVGATALAGLTLLECGVHADDPAVAKAAAAVRRAGVQLTATYAVALSIMFLDRLGEPADVPLIESLAVRLLAGQSPTTGGWHYECPPLAEAEMHRLNTVLQQPNPRAAGPDVPQATGRRTVRDLPREIQAQLQQINRGGAAPGPLNNGGDNSNTQFASIALWIARRQGIPVETALRRIDARFRVSQEPDGGWSYTPRSPTQGIGMGAGSTPTMTCAGLLGLALSHGEAVEASLAAGKGAAAPAGAAARGDPNKDPAVRTGLLALGSCIGTPVPMINPQTNGRGYYFLWSLERVAVAYGLNTIGNKDWYGWGADILLRNQGPDGSWQAEFAQGGADTCFALLFLRRANLVEDLTATFKGRVQDPATRELRAGGLIGNATQKQIGLQPAFEVNQRAAPAEKSTDEQPNTARTAPPTEKPAPEQPQSVDTARGDADAGRLSAELINADPGKQEEVLDKLRDSKGAVYTDALAQAIPKLTGDAKAKARDALADRLVRMTSATLTDKLRDADLEIRRAAALACAMKEDKMHVPRLIELLADPEPTVGRAAHAALKSLTGQDFGPEADASQAQAADAMRRWDAWWRKNK